jgi:holo-[acyl-carrier protein] synthase
MIIGVGIDVVDVERFAAVLRRTPRLAERVFTEGERRLPINSLAARFAAKEALVKALGAPAGLHWQDAEVRTTDSGRPLLEVRGSVSTRAAELGVVTWHVSLSHDAGIASAVVIAEG